MLDDDVRKIKPCFKMRPDEYIKDSSKIDEMIVLNNGKKVCPHLWKNASSQIMDALETGKAITGKEHEVTSVSMYDGNMSSISVGVQIRTKKDVSRIDKSI